MGSARSIGILTVLNAAGAGIALANSVVVACFFGTTRPLEVFFAASTLQGLVTSLTQTGQLAEIFLPIYHRLKHDQGVEAARRAFSIVVNWMVLLVLALSAMLWFLAPALLGLLVPGFSAGDRVLGVWMFRSLLGLLGIQACLSLVGTLANAEKWFGGPEAISVASRLGIVIAIALLAVPLGVWAMVASLWVGTAIHVLGYLVMLRRMGYRHRLCLRQEGFSAASVFYKLVVTFGYVGATQVYAFALSAALSLLEPGTYAAFKYAQTLYSRTNSVLLRPVSIVFFTHFSEALANGAENLRDLARSALGRCLGIAVLVASAVLVCGRPLVGGLWGSRHFGGRELDLAAQLLGVFYLLLFASALNQIARKITMSFGMVQRQYWSTAVVQVLSAAAAWALIRPLGMTGAMVTIAGNEVALALAPLAVLAWWRRDLVVFYPPGLVWRWAAAGAGGVAAAYGLVLASSGHTLVGGRLGQLLWAAALGATAMTVAVAVAWLLNVYEVRKGLRVVLAKARLGGAESGSAT